MSTLWMTGRGSPLQFCCAVSNICNILLGLSLRKESTQIPPLFLLLPLLLLLLLLQVCSSCVYHWKEGVVNDLSVSSCTITAWNVKLVEQVMLTSYMREKKEAWRA